MFLVALEFPKQSSHTDTETLCGLGFVVLCVVQNSEDMVFFDIGERAVLGGLCGTPRGLIGGGGVGRGFVFGVLDLFR